MTSDAREAKPPRANLGVQRSAERIRGKQVLETRNSRRASL